MKKKIMIVIELISITTILGCSTYRPDNVSIALTEPITSVQVETITIKDIPDEQLEKEIEETNVVIKESQISEEPDIPEDIYATIVSYGDTLVHSQIYKSAYDSEINEYDFTPMFEYIEKYFENATIVVGNSESPFAGPEKGYSGYPCFNAPEHLAVDLRELGTDILTTSNNHCLDKGFSGLSSTLDYMDDADIHHVGTARSKEEQDSILYEDLNGIRTAFLSYTYGTNGISIPQDKDFCVNLIDKDLILSQIEKAKSEGADAIVVSMHWGIEYQTVENAQQDELAEFLIANDVDVILGCHPHVLQPMKMLTIPADDGSEKQGLVIFSQGNFFSAQTDTNTRNTAIFNIKLKKDGVTNEVSIAEATYVPLFLYDNKSVTGISPNRYKLLDLEEIIRSYEAGEDTWNEDMYNLAKIELERCVNTIGQEIINTTNY